MCGVLIYIFLPVAFVLSIINCKYDSLNPVGKFSEAEPLMRHALEVDERTFGPIHQNVATCLNNLAQQLQATNRLREAWRSLNGLGASVHHVRIDP
jgi:hypothetical protein